MDQVFIEFLSSLPLHGLLLMGIIVLYRDNQKLREKLEAVRQVSSGNTALLLQQNDELNAIKQTVNGNTPNKNISPIRDEPYTAMPPYRKGKNPPE